MHDMLLNLCVRESWQVSAYTFYADFNLILVFYVIFDNKNFGALI